MTIGIPGSAVIAVLLIVVSPSRLRAVAAGIVFPAGLQCGQQVVEPLVALVPERLADHQASQVVTSRSGSASRRLSRAVARRVRDTRPACSSTFRCRETARAGTR